MMRLGKARRHDHQLPVTGSLHPQFKSSPQFLWLLTLLPALLLAQHDMLWLRSLTGNGSGSDRLQSMTSDPQGNVYVAIRGTLHGYCMITAKYSPAGDMLWWRRFTHPDEVEPAGIAVDASGSVFVAGATGEFTSSSNIVIVKYSASGDSCWSAEYDADGRADVASAINLDRSGDVYVSGTTDLGSAGLDGMLLKYRNDGQFVYMRLNPQTSSRDSICAAVVDSSGYIYQVGDFGTDFVVLKYALDGTYQWSQTYWTRGRYRLRACALDPMGNLLACGTSQPHWDTSSFLTAKYDPSGARLWVREIAKYDDGGWLNFATSIGSDARGDIYVAGCGPGADSISSGILVVKYAHDGTELWSQMNTALWGDESGAAMCVTPSGEVYVTGCAEAVVKYSTSGESLWVRTWNSMSPTPGTAVALTPAGGVYVGGWISDPDDSDILLCYIADGTRLWKKQLNISPGFSYDRTNDVTFDSTGNVIAVGHTDETGNSADIAVFKCSPTGESLWVQKYHMLAGGYADEALKVKVDGSNNIYVMGYSYAEARAKYWTTLKYAPDGTLLWARNYHGPVDDDYEDQPEDMAIDRLGDVLLTGTNSGGHTFLDCVALKYSPDGVLRWERRYAGSGDSVLEVGLAIATDSFGDVYVAASRNLDTTWRSIRGIVIKYDADGNQQWLTQPFDFWGCPWTIGLDQSGDIYICGTGLHPVHGGVVAAAKLHGNGDTAWTLVLPYDTNGLPVLHGGFVANDGRVFLVAVGMWCESTATFAFGPDGRVLWRSSVFGSDQWWNRKLAMDRVGNLYETQTPGPSGSAHFRLVEFDTTGRICWADSFPTDSASILSVACGPEGRVALCGCFSRRQDLYEAVFVPRTYVMEPVSPSLDNAGLTLDVQPSLFRDGVRLIVKSRYVDVTLRAFDANGRLVRTLSGNSSGGAWVCARWDGTNGQGHPAPAGIYFVVAEAHATNSVCARSVLRKAVKVTRIE